MKIITISLGGTSYSINQLPIGPSKAWRAQFAEPIERMMGALHATGNILGQQVSDGVELGRMVAGLGGMLMTDIGQVLLGSTDSLMDMLAAYAPQVAADRPRIEAEAYDDEVMRAFVEVLKLAYPFGEILQLAKPGPTKTETKKN